MKSIICTNYKFVRNKYDIALCNRLLWWELAEYINQKHQYSFDTIFSKSAYYDIHQVLNIPNLNIDNGSNICNSIIGSSKNLESISIDDLHEILIENKTLNSEKSYKFNFTFTSISDEVDDRPIRKITLKDEKLKNITNRGRDFLGIHVRRNAGVTALDDDIKTLPIELQNTYKNLLSKTSYSLSGYKFYSDDLYFRVIEEILNIDSNQKFFISHDLTEDFFVYWKERYPNHIYTQNDFTDQYYPDKKIKKDIFDLFFLSNTPFMITSPNSTWSDFARTYKSKTFWNDVDDNLEQILQNYKNYKLI